MEYSNIVKELYDNYQIEIGAKSFRDQILDNSQLSHHGTENTYAQNIWLFLRKEIYSLLCTNSTKYKKERKLIKSTAAPVIALFSGLLTQKYNIAVAEAGTIAALAILVPIRLSLNAWCSSVKDDEKTIARIEINELGEDWGRPLVYWFLLLAQAFNV